MEGINVEKGLENSLGNIKSYAALLKTFISSGDMDKADSSLAEEDIASYRITVHAMKSAARYIGAEELSDWAKHLEDLAKENKTGDIIADHPKLRMLYNTVYSSITDAIKSYEEFSAKEAPKSQGSASPGKMKRLVRDLVLSFEDMDYDAAEEIGQELGDITLWDPEADKIMQEVNSLIEGFDYDEAEAKAGELMKLLEESHIG